jgi:hypothetical protein
MRPLRLLAAALLTGLTAGCAVGSASLPQGVGFGRSAPLPAPGPLGPRVVAMGEPAHYAGLSLTPLAVVEDSRCPAGVQCIQAGTVRITTQVIAGPVSELTVLRLGVPTPVAGGRAATLVGFCPTPTVRPRVLPLTPTVLYDVSPAGAAPVIASECPAPPPERRRRFGFF